MNPVASRFRAMNTNIMVLTPIAGPESERAFSVVRQIFHEIECCLSRFKPASELCALNRSGGEPFQASPLLYEAVSLAVSAAKETAGIFDPTILAALEAAGYDRSFERISKMDGVLDANASTVRLPDYRNICCDPHRGTIQLGGNQRIDLGGIGKGMAVDRALASTGFLADRCIAAGGDLAVRGAAGLNEEWTVALEDAGTAGQSSVVLRDAAMATSTVTKRRWELNGRDRHHLIDARTGRSSSSSLRTVTTVAPSCVQADVAAKTALLLGDEGMEFLDGRGMFGFAVRHDGSTVQTTYWPNLGREA